MRTASAQIIDAIYTLLNGAAGSSWTWYAGDAPDGTDRPYGVIGEVIAQDDDAQGIDGGDHTVILHHYADYARAVHVAMQETEQLLHNQSLSVGSGWTAWWVKRDGTDNIIDEGDVDWRFWHGIQPYRIRTEYTTPAP